MGYGAESSYTGTPKSKCEKPQFQYNLHQQCGRGYAIAYDSDSLPFVPASCACRQQYATSTRLRLPSVLRWLCFTIATTTVRSPYAPPTPFTVLTSPISL
eukprot:2588015-Rhodomonas_salina.1